MNYKFTSRSEEDTLELAENIESEKFPGMLICLDGELGSGKTVFVKGFASALGIEWCINQCQELIKHGVPSIHFYTVGAVESIKQVAKAIY